MIELPEIGTFEDVMRYLKLARQTIYRMACKKEFRHGIYLGRGRFNMHKLKYCIEKHGSYLREKIG